MFALGTRAVESQRGGTEGSREQGIKIGGSGWVRFFWGIGVLGVKNAVIWLRFVILRFGVKPVLPCSCGLAFSRLRKRTSRTARRPYVYITPRVIAWAGDVERSGKKKGPRRVGAGSATEARRDGGERGDCRFRISDWGLGGKRLAAGT